MNTTNMGLTPVIFRGWSTRADSLGNGAKTPKNAIQSVFQSDLGPGKENRREPGPLLDHESITELPDLSVWQVFRAEKVPACGDLELASPSEAVLLCYFSFKSPFGSSNAKPLPSSAHARYIGIPKSFLRLQMNSLSWAVGSTSSKTIHLSVLTLPG